MNVAAIFNLYKSIEPPVYARHIAEIMRRVEQELQAQEDLETMTRRPRPHAVGHIARQRAAALSRSPAGAVSSSAADHADDPVLAGGV